MVTKVRADEVPHPEDAPWREWWEGLGETLERELTEHKDPLDLGAMAEV